MSSPNKKARSFVRGSELDSQQFQDTRMFSYDEIFADDFCTSGIHRVTQGEVRARNTRSGANFTTLGHFAFYDFWEDYLRPEYAIAKGVLDRNERDRDVKDAILREHASRDLWGDLYHLSTSIVHKQGIATEPSHPLLPYGEGRAVSSEWRVTQHRGSSRADLCCLLVRHAGVRL
jgi:hypothetical protein